MTVVFVQAKGLSSNCRRSWTGDERVVTRQTWVRGGGFVRFQRRTRVVRSLEVRRAGSMPRPAPGVAVVLEMSYTCRGYRVGR